jgi:ubiquinone/menaquinone biosynthesis C-methylase UbiE
MSDKNRAGYDEWAAFYDAYRNPTVAIDEINFSPFWSHLSGKRVLEIGCGTGRHTRKLAAFGNLVEALDPSPGMLEVARKKVPAKAVRFIEGDILTYSGFDEGSFDAALVSLVLEHIADLEEFFEKVSKLIRKGGELFLSEIHPTRAARGSLAHFVRPESGEEIRLVSYAHSERAIREAAHRFGFQLETEKDVVADAEFSGAYPEWRRYLGVPMIKIFVFRRN